MVKRGEWITLAVVFLCYGLWVWATGWLAATAPVFAILIAAAMIALHSSLTHEVIHGHPTPWQRVNEALVFPALMLLIPFVRFRDTHLAHHHDARLTDPFDDPESNFMDGTDWDNVAPALQALLRINNTLIGRFVLGPAIAQAWFMTADWRAIRQGDRQVLFGWLWHLPAVALVLIWIGYSPMAVWHYVLAAYLGNGFIKIRTFCEHQAHELSRARTVIIEDRGPLALLFLNNNLHAVHHKHPQIAWYDLPRLYRLNRERFLAMNEGYSFASYWQVLRLYAFRTKDPVPHPLWRRG